MLVCLLGVWGAYVTTIKYARNQPVRRKPQHVDFLGNCEAHVMVTGADTTLAFYNPLFWLGLPVPGSILCALETLGRN